jgi:hypothetical protein
VTQIVTTAQLRDKAERCRRLARGVDDPLTTKLAAEADEQAAEEAPRR